MGSRKKRAKKIWAKSQKGIQTQFRGKLIRFFLLFFLISAGLFSLFYFWKNGTLALQRFTALVSGGILRVFGFSVSVQDTTYSVSGVAIEIIPECTGLYEIIVLSAIILSYPADFLKKVVGVIGGVFSLLVLNLIRLLILALVGMRSRELMDWVHLYLWQLTLILFVVGLFLAWLSWSRKPQFNPKGQGAPPLRSKKKPMEDEKS